MSIKISERSITNDALWLIENRERLCLRQSDISAYLTLVSRQSVNQGRIVEIERGQRALSSEWRELLDNFFECAGKLKSEGKDWRSMFL